MRIFFQKYIVEYRNDLNSKIHEYLYKYRKPLNIIGGENTDHKYEEKYYCNSERA